MKKSILYICTALLLVVLFACEKDNDYGTLPVTPVSNSDYLPDNTANSWVYDIYRVDSSGVETLLGTDTMTVSDTMVGGKKYKKYKYRLFPNSRLFQLSMRDSAGFMVTETGRKVFTTSPLNTILEQDSITTSFILSYEMIKEPNCITVPTATYCDVLNYRNLVEYHPQVPNFHGKVDKRYAHTRYAKDIGLIYNSYFYAGDLALNIYERRLVSYTIVK